MTSIVSCQTRQKHKTLHEQFFLCFQVTGMAIHMAFTNMDAMIEQVQRTQIHCTEIPGTEFALSVYIHPYPNDILSVWIFLATLVKRQQGTCYLPPNRIDHVCLHWIEHNISIVRTIPICSAEDINKGWTNGNVVVNKIWSFLILFINSLYVDILWV